MSFRVGAVLQVRFWDHTENMMEAACIEAVGIVEAQNELWVRLVCWRDWADPTAEDNTTRFCILRSTIIKTRELQ